MKPGKYLIWSNEHQAWRQANSAGYTKNLQNAGDYTRDEALDICETAFDGWDHMPNGIPSEIPVSVNDLLVLEFRAKRRKDDG